MEKQDLILKKDARILWNTNKEGKVTDLIVAEFSKDNMPMYLYKEYRSDVGNCLSYWDTWSVAYIIFDIMVRNEFANQKAKDDAWDELLKIKELREDILKASRMTGSIAGGINFYEHPDNATFKG